MKEYGYYDDARREYVISDPATPWPWINYLGNDDFFSLVSNTAGGYCFCRDAKFRRILRYRYNSVPADSGGRYFYIKDDDLIWSPGWKPCRTPLDFYECRHGLGYTVISGEKNGVRVDVTLFVPLGERCEIHRVVVTNKSKRQKTLDIFSFVEWCLWNASSDMENFQRNLSTGEVEIDGSVIYHKTEYKERRNHYAFYGVNYPISGFDTDRETFLGPYNGFEFPQVVSNGRSENSVAHGWSPVASHHFKLNLQPGEMQEIEFVLGYVENPQQMKFTEEEEVLQSTASCPVINKKGARSILSAFNTPQKVSSALEELSKYWDSLLDKFHLESPEIELDRSVNVWNQYQCVVTFNMSRSTSYFESGIGRGMGFRDSNQDLVGFVHLMPEKARQRIIDIASTQFPDGGCYHQYQPLTKHGNNDIGGGFNDDPLWLIFGTISYIKETGDLLILDEPVPFDNKLGSEVPLLEHLRISFDHVLHNIGPHGLPLIGRADWNDCLNLNCFSNNPDESFQTTENKTEGSMAESLMIAGQFVFCGNEYAALCRHIGNEAEADRVEREVKEMVKAVKRYGWDGEWFLRAYDYEGKKVGSRENDEGQIFIESQGWCSMAGIGKEEGMVDKALDSVKVRLDSDWGIVLNNPAFTKYKIEYGEISTYPAGYKENAGVFSHNNPWIIIAEARALRTEDAWSHFRKICPAYCTDPTLHKVEPYVYCQMVAGKDAARPGEGKNSWLTGTSAWAWYTVSQFLLGIRPDYDDLIIDPRMPHDWNRFTVERRFRDASYHIEVRRTGKRSLKLDNNEIKGDRVPYLPGNHIIECTI